MFTKIGNQEILTLELPKKMSPGTRTRTRTNRDRHWEDVSFGAGSGSPEEKDHWLFASSISTNSLFIGTRPSCVFKVMDGTVCDVQDIDFHFNIQLWFRAIGKRKIKNGLLSSNQHQLKRKITTCLTWLQNILSTVSASLGQNCFAWQHYFFGIFILFWDLHTFLDVHTFFGIFILFGSSEQKAWKSSFTSDWGGPGEGFGGVKQRLRTWFFSH